MDGEEFEIRDTIQEGHIPTHREWMGTTTFFIDTGQHAGFPFVSHV